MSIFTVTLSTATEILLSTLMVIGLPVAGVNYYDVSLPLLIFTLVPSTLTPIFYFVESAVSTVIVTPLPAVKICLRESLLLIN